MPQTDVQRKAALDAANLSPIEKSGVSAGIGYTPTAPQSPFSSSAMPIISQAATQAQNSALTSLNKPPENKPTVSISLPNGRTITPNSMYQYMKPDGTIISIGDPTINPTLVAGAQFISGPTGKESAPVIPGQGGGASTVPAGYTVGATDAQGNTTYSNTTTGHTFTIPAGTQNPSQVANRVASVHAQVQSSLGQGFTTAPLANGNIQISDPSGNPLGTVSPEVSSSPASLAEAMGQFTGYHSTITAANASADASNAENDAGFQEQLQQLKMEEDAAVGEELAASGGGLGSNSTAISAVKQRYDQLKTDLRSKYQAQKLAIQSGKLDAITKADSDLQGSLQTITENAKQTSINVSDTAFSQKNTALSAATNLMTKLNLPTSTIQGLAIKPDGTTGNDPIDAVIKQFTSAGYSPEQALALTQSGSIAQNKLNMTDWLNTVKNFPITEDVTGMSLEDAQKNPFYKQLISDGANVLGTPGAAWAAIQSGSMSSLQAIKLQQQTLEVQAMTAKAQIEAALAPERFANMTLNQSISEANRITTEQFKTGAPLAPLLAVSNWMPNIESAVKQGGKGYSAATLLDALVKIDTGGQAIRQGQINLGQESGTWGDSFKRLTAKLGWGDNIGANTVLTPGQVQQIYTLAKQTSAEKIQATMPAYTAYKNGIESLKQYNPNAQAEIDGASYVTAVDSFMDTYGKDLGAGTSAQEGDTHDYNGTTYKLMNGTWTPQ